MKNIKEISDYIADGSNSITHEMVIRQLVLEESYVGHVYDHQMDKITKPRLDKEGRPTRIGHCVGDTKAGQALLKRVSAPVAAEITKWINGVVKNGRGCAHGSAAIYLKDADPELLAYITGRTLLQAVCMDLAATAARAQIGQTVLEEMNLREFAHDHAEHWQFLNKVALKHTTGARHRSRVLNVAMSRDGHERLVWPAGVKTAVGVILADIWIATTGLLAIEDRYTTKHGRTTTKPYVVCLPETKQWITEATRTAALMHPKYGPMIVPPLPWTTLDDGGYLSLETKLVQHERRECLEELRHMLPESLIKTANALQATPWAVNSRVLAVVAAVWRQDATGFVGLLPSMEPGKVPDKPEDIDTNEEARKAWRKAAHKVHTENAKEFGGRFLAANIIQIAEQHCEDEAIYFPHYADWRGRLYPKAQYLQPQGSDLAKGLLQFAKGKALGADGYRWLAIRMAGLCGVDKVSMDERVAWVESQQAAIIDSALNPLDGGRWWAVQDSGECAWQVLATCFELEGYWREGESFESHLPVPLDATCSGIQNFSAMLRDPKGGYHVNLVPHHKPNDIYGEVGKAVKAELERRVALRPTDPGDYVVVPDEAPAEDGKKKPKKINPYAVEGTREWYALAEALVPHIDRSLMKRPVMTLPYGATKQGFVGQLEEVFKERHKACLKHGHGALNQHALLWDEKANYHAPSAYLAPIVWGAIEDKLPGAVQTMSALKSWARVAASNALPVTWITPAGLLVTQVYSRRQSKRLDLMVSGRRLRCQIEEATEEIDLIRHANAISPNFVHSCDAAFLQLTTCACLEQGVDSFNMIHDSFGTYPSDTTALARVLREEFVRMYRDNDVLGNFRHQLLDQLDAPEQIAKMQEPPAVGDLDLSLIMESEYFFC